MKKLLLQKEREDVTSSHKVSQVQNESNFHVRNDISDDCTTKISPQLITTQPLITSRSSINELQSFYEKHEVEKAITRPSLVSTGIYPGLRPVPVQAVATGHLTAFQVNGTLGQTVKIPTNRQEYLRSDLAATGNGHLTVSAGLSGAQYFADKQLLLQQPPPLTWMSNMGKYLPMSFNGSSQGIQEAASNRLHATPFEDSLTRYTEDSRAGSSCASNTAEESAESMRDVVSEDSRQEFDDNASDEFLRPDNNMYHGDTSTRDTDSPVSRAGSETFKSPVSMKSGRSKYHAGRTAKSSSSSASVSGNSKSPSKAVSDGISGSGGRSIIRCPICGKLFNNSSALAKHKLTHSDERKYTCSTCSKSFKRQDHLNGHMMTHSSKKPFECKFIGCSKSYCDARSLRRHLENHHQDFIGASNGTPGSVLSSHAVDEQSSYSEMPKSEFGNGIPENDGRRQSASPFDPKQIWTTGYNPLDEPKPVKCHICDRGFKNIAALNGHMRLHGGYVRKDNAETKSEMNESMDGIYHNECQASRGLTPQLSISSSQSSGRQELTVSGGLNHVSNSSAAMKEERFERSELVDNPSFAAFRYHNKDRMPDLLRNTSEGYAFSGHIESKMQKNGAVLENNIPRPTSEVNSSAYMFNAGSINMKREPSRERCMPQELTASKSRLYDELLLWSKVSQEAKYGVRAENYESHLAREIEYGGQMNGSNNVMSREPNVLVHQSIRSSEKRASVGQHLNNVQLQSYVSHYDAKACVTTSDLQANYSMKPHTATSGWHRGKDIEEERKIETVYGLTQHSRPPFFHDIGKLISLPTSDAHHGYRGIGRESSEKLDSMPQVTSTNSFRSSKPMQTLDCPVSMTYRPTTATHHAIKVENTMETYGLESSMQLPLDLNSSTVNKSNVGCAFQPVMFNEAEEERVTYGNRARLATSEIDGKHAARDVQRELNNSQASSTLSPDGDKMSSIEADKADSLYRRRVKNLMLKHNGELAKDVDSQTTINSPRLGGEFTIPSTDMSLQDSKLSESSNIGCGVQLGVAGESFSQVPASSAFCETGSPCQTRSSRTSDLDSANKSSDGVTRSCVVSGTQTNDCTRQHVLDCSSNTCCMQIEKNAVNFCPIVCGQSSTVGYTKTDLSCTREARECDAATDIRQCCNSTVTSSGTLVDCGQVQHKVTTDQDFKCCPSMKCSTGRCHVSHYPVGGCSKVLSHPSTPSCGDAVFLATRHLGCCTKSQVGTPTCHGAGRCSCVGIGSDIGVVECAHGQRTPVVLHCPQVVAFAEHMVRVGCCQPTFAVPSSPCDHRQQVIVPRTPCMAHTPRDYHSQRQDACTPRDGHFQHSCRAILTPASAVATQPCHFQFPPCVSAPCEAVLLRSPYTPHAACVPCCTPSASPHCNHQQGNDRGHSRQTCKDDDVFDAVLSCDRDRERLMRLVELEVEERLKLRRQSEVEDAEKSSTQKDTIASRPKCSSTPVEPDSTVSTDYAEDKAMSDNETESSDTEVCITHRGRQIQHFETDGAAAASDVFPVSGLQIAAEKSRPRKRKHTGEDFVPRKTDSPDDRSEETHVTAPHNCIRVESRLHLETQINEVCLSASNKRDTVSPEKPNNSGPSIKHRPWVEFESRNENAFCLPEIPNIHVEKLVEQGLQLVDSRPDSLSVSSRDGHLQVDGLTGEQSAKRSKKRPQPLVILPNVEKESSNPNVGYQSWLRSPCLKRCANVLPYTPPPMLSPTRSGSGLFWTLNEASTATVARPREQSSPSQQEDDGKDDMPVITDTMPHINIGTRFQAQLPSCTAKRSNALKDDERATLVWHPAIAKKLGKFAVHDYEQYSCSAIIPGNGANREYAFHLLHQCRGNIKKAMKLLMNREPKMPSTSTLQSYYYEECTEWKPNEIESFKNAILKCDKDFCQIAKRVGSKTRAECVQFYYVWKKLNIEDYRRLRVLRRRREQTELYKLRSTSIK